MQKVKDYTKFKSYLADRERHYPFIHDMVIFYKGLLDIWSSYSPDDLSALFRSPAAVSKKGESDELYLLDTTRIDHLDLTNSIKIARDVFKLFEAYMKADQDTVFSGSSSDTVREFIGKGLLKDDRFKNALLKWILKPSFENTLGRLKPEPGLGKGKCPLCAAPPAMAIVYSPEKETSEQRLLSCCFCTYRWHYPMTGCPYCGNERPERFGLIVGDSVRDQCVRAVSCEDCKTYLKTVFTGCRSDRKKPEDIDIDIEDVATLNLDIMADQRGFTALCHR